MGITWSVRETDRVNDLCQLFPNWLQTAVLPLSFWTARVEGASWLGVSHPAVVSEKGGGGNKKLRDE